MTGVLDVSKGDLVGLVIGPGGPGATAAVATGTATARITLDEIATMEAELGPRWVVWSQATTGALVAAGIRVARAWDLVAVHRLLYGGWSSDPGRIWARLNGLSTANLPQVRPPDLFNQVDPTAAGNPSRDFR